VQQEVDPQTAVCKPLVRQNKWLKNKKHVYAVEKSKKFKN
jgi:hypothetical protein